MNVRPTPILSWLLALLCLASPGQLHGLLHHQDGPVPTGIELHDGTCSHFPEHEDHHQECALCATGRIDLGPALPVAGLEVPACTPAAPPEVVLDRRPITAPHGALGARAPPRLG